MLGTGTNVQMAWYDANGVAQSIFSNLSANGNQWSASFIAHSGSYLGVTAYTDSTDIQIYLDNVHVLEASVLVAGLI